MKWPLLAIVRRQTERGPDAAGATSVNLLPRRPRRGQAAAPLAFLGPSESCAFAAFSVRRFALNACGRSPHASWLVGAWSGAPAAKTASPVLASRLVLKVVGVFADFFFDSRARD